MFCSTICSNQCETFKTLSWRILFLGSLFLSGRWFIHQKSFLILQTECTNGLISKYFNVIICKENGIIRKIIFCNCTFVCVALPQESKNCSYTPWTLVREKPWISQCPANARTYIWELNIYSIKRNLKKRLTHTLQLFQCPWRIIIKSWKSTFNQVDTSICCLGEATMLSQFKPFPHNVCFIPYSLMTSSVVCVFW